ncbi:hypothetical protein FAVG1_08408 [Fusarium avenaceum]|nr:hypothetical protein FAVG1_08408 [Fusarium avenaceum]
MPVLAIAGGTSWGLGRALTTAVLSRQHATPWTPVILSRTTSPPLWLRAVDPNLSRVKIRAVDYTSLSSLESALEDVDTLISVTNSYDGTQAQIQGNLLHAAIKAGCRRFAPSQWGMGPQGYEALRSLKLVNKGVWEECLEHQDKIECARFNNGMFLNYLANGIYDADAGPGAIKDNETKFRELREGRGYAPGFDMAGEGIPRAGDLKDGSGSFLISLSKGIAELPVTDEGRWPRITTTTLRDIGRFVSAALDLPKWEHDMSMAGDTITMGKLFGIAEEVTGKRFEVQKLTSGDLEKQLSELKPDQFMEALWLEFKLMYCRDVEGEGILTPIVNGLYPEVKPVSVKEYLERYWSCREQL